MKVSEYIAAFLISKGVNTVFSVTGGASAELNDAFLRSGKLELIYAHNESSCSYMAEGYYRRTGKVSACLVTVGPGSTNLLTGIYGCWVDSVPTIVISGQSFTNQTIGKSGLRQLGTQEADIIEVVKSFTKFSKMIYDPTETTDTFELAWNLMVTPRKGPVWLDVPADIQRSEIAESSVPTQSGSYLPLRETLVHQDKKNICEFVGQFIERLSSSSRPILHIGNGIRNFENKSKFTNIVTSLQLPVLLTHNSYDMLPTNHKLNFGFPGIFGHRYANLMVQNCDLYLGIGTRLTMAQTGYAEKAFAKNAETFLVDIDEHELNKKHLRIDHFLCNEAWEVLEEIRQQMGKFNSSEKKSRYVNWLSFGSILREKYDILNEHVTLKTDKVSPYRFMRKLSVFLNEGDAVLTDMGTSYQSTYQSIQIPDGCSLQTNTGFAAMGWGLPAAIGSTFASKFGKTLCITGDGGLMMSIQELASIPKESQFYIFVYNNEGYLTQRQTQESTFGRVTGADTSSGLTFPNYELLAAAFSLDYRLIKDEENLERELQDIFNSKSPILVEVKMSLQQAQAPKLVNHKDSSGKYVQAQLDNMWPFLQESEWLEIYNMLESI
jgi:acetolactate synthase-1/2/3 large subunit